ncbi:MAG: efflux RND transporter periplasmic adaptor subunit [Bacteroidales bacterium]|nr:efflux RND transporter periplasmic adaptor subunit [Bacteroidales bacterium]
MKTKHFLWIAVSVVLIATSCAKKPAINENIPEVVCVEAQHVVETDAARTIQCAGLLSSKRISKLSFKTGGIINRLYVEEGSRVSKGQLLATLDMTEIAAQVQQAKVAFEKADRDLKRAKNLYADSVVTLEQLQNATSVFDAALETKNIAEFNQRYSRIMAPANGKIISILAEENELTGPGMPVLVFGEQGSNEWVVKTGISDKDMVSIRKGDKATVTFDAYQGKEFSAQVTQLAEVVDLLSGTFEIELSVKQGDTSFINGMVASIKINSSNTQRVSLIPPDAIAEANGNKGFVYVVNADNTSAKKIPVTVAYIQDNEIAVYELLSKAGQVITKGAAFMEEGTRINIVR